MRRMPVRSAGRGLAAMIAAGFMVLLAGCDGVFDDPAEPAAAGGQLFASDTGARRDPIPFWGAIDCADDSRVGWFKEGGDPAPTATGAAQEDNAFRRLTVLDGDDYYGERCELGENDARVSPVVFYREGDRVTTFISIRLPDGFPLNAQSWQGPLQMKQVQPANNGGGTPVISLSAFDGQWSLWHSGPGFTDEDFQMWAVPARTGIWTRFAFDVAYSANPDRGSIQVWVDLNADGDFSDLDEVSPVFRTNTLKREIEGDANDGYVTGEPLPSHLRAGIYHDEVIPCPPPAGCAVDIDNVQVVHH
jgi:hypothetical protein